MGVGHAGTCVTPHFVDVNVFYRSGIISENYLLVCASNAKDGDPVSSRIRWTYFDRRLNVYVHFGLLLINCSIVVGLLITS